LVEDGNRRGGVVLRPLIDEEALTVLRHHVMISAIDEHPADAGVEQHIWLAGLEGDAILLTSAAIQAPSGAR
jgi:hypothetical protein